jgi:hypothetical protein
MPVDEGRRFSVDRDSWLAARVGVADLGGAVLDEQPEALVARSLIVEDERDDQPVGGQRGAVELDLAPGPEGEPGVGMYGADLDPTLTPLRQRRDDRGEVAAGVGEQIAMTSAVGFGTTLITPARSSSSRRVTSIDRDIWGTPRAMEVNVSAPNMRLRISNGVQRDARISDARASGQYWP